MCPRHNGVRNERYKLIQIYEFGEWEFYDLEKDPDELSNVYNDPEYQDEVSAMKSELERLRTKYGDNTVTGMKTQAWRDKYRLIK